MDVNYLNYLNWKRSCIFVYLYVCMYADEMLYNKAQKANTNIQLKNSSFNTNVTPHSTPTHMSSTAFCKRIQTLILIALLLRIKNSYQTYQT